MFSFSCHQEKHQDVCQGTQNNNTSCPVSAQNAGNHAISKKRYVKIRQPFDLDRDNKVQKHLHIRKTDRKAKENRKADIIGAECSSHQRRIPIHCVLDSIQQEGTEDRHQNTRKDINVIFEISPGSFKTRSD